MSLYLLSLFAFSLTLYTTSTGSGLAPDSYVYIASARSLLLGDGLRIPTGPSNFIPFAHFPPLFPGILAFIGLIGVDPIDVARWLNAFLFGANVFLMGYVIYQYSNGSTLAAALGSVLALSSQGLIKIHIHVWSEPTFIFLSLLGLYLISRYHQSQRRGLLISAGVVTGLALLTRYAGITLLFTGVVSLLLFRDISVEEKGRRVLLFLGIGITPFGTWMIRNRLVIGSLTNRMIAYHPLSLRDLLRGGETITSWIYPVVLPTALRDPVALLAMLTCVVFLIRSVLMMHPYWKYQASRDYQKPLSYPFALFSLIYLLTMFLSMSFFDAQTSLDVRILSPIFCSILVLLVTGASDFLARRSNRIRGTILVLAGSLVVVHLMAGWALAGDLHRGVGKGYSDPTWVSSRLLSQVGDLPDGRPIYSNGHDVIYLLTGKPAIGLPHEISPNSLRINETIDAEVLEMETVLREEKGYLVLFDALVDRRWYLPAEDELNKWLPLKRVSRWKDEGTLYRLAP